MQETKKIINRVKLIIKRDIKARNSKSNDAGKKFPRIWQTNLLYIKVYYLV